jgi:hypothetical protein
MLGGNALAGESRCTLLPRLCAGLRNAAGKTIALSPYIALLAMHRFSAIISGAIYGSRAASCPRPGLGVS